MRKRKERGSPHLGKLGICLDRLSSWLKAVNDGLMQNGNDPGLDGNIPSSGSNPNRWSGRDVAGLELGYYHSTTTVGYDDYNAIGNNGHISTKTGSNFKETQVPLYNGNINHTVTTLPNKAQIALNNVVADPLGTNYQYDQLNRLKESINYTNVNTSTNAWLSTLSVGTIPQQWQMRQSYDAMGNITSLVRHAQGGTGVAMDSLMYTYNDNQWTNQLTHVDDIITAGAHTEDIDDQAANNYDYDEIGNLIKDDAEEIASIEWTVYGKIKKITRTTTSTKPDLEFEYNTAGQRVKKTVYPKTTDPYETPKTTIYVRDASGNIMAVYTYQVEVLDAGFPGGGSVTAQQVLALEELHMYGSSRLGSLTKYDLLTWREGVYQNTSDEFTPNDPDIVNHYPMPSDGMSAQEVGWKYYELTNHLGNVLAVFTDRKVPSINAATGSYNFFNAQVTSVTDYYPFGMQIEERTWSFGVYRFGFNGQEKDNEVSGAGNSNTAEYWQYDTRLGRRWNVDPVEKEWESDYACFFNNPIRFIDPNGDDGFYDEKGNFLYDDKSGGTNNYIVNRNYYDMLKKDKDCHLDLNDFHAKLRQYGTRAYSTEDAAASAWASEGYSATRTDNMERAAIIAYAKGSDGVDLYVVGSTVKGAVSNDAYVNQEVDPFDSKVTAGGVDLLSLSYTIKTEYRIRRRYPDQWGNTPPLVRWGLEDNPIESEYWIYSTYNYWSSVGVVHTHPIGNDEFSASPSKTGDFRYDIQYPIAGDVGLARTHNVYLVPTTQNILEVMYKLEKHHYYATSIYKAQEKAERNKKEIRINKK